MMIWAQLEVVVAEVVEAEVVEGVVEGGEGIRHLGMRSMFMR